MSFIAWWLISFYHWLVFQCMTVGLSCHLLKATLVASTAAAKSLHCVWLCDPINGSPPGSAVPGILQARTLEWVAISFSNAWKWKVKVKLLSHVRPSTTPWTAAFQALLSMGFSRQEYWSGVPLPSLYFNLHILISEGLAKKHPRYLWVRIAPLTPC